MAYRIRLLPEAEADLAAIYVYVRDHASPEIARAYIRRIQAFLSSFDTLPERGTRRDDVRPGLRLVGFERRIAIAFVIEGEEVVFTNILYGGRQLPETSDSADPALPRKT